MKKISKSKVEHLAKLAGLSLSKKELRKFQRQLSEILDYFNRLKEVDTTQAGATSQVTGLENVFRADQVNPGLSQKEALSGSKSTQKGYFKIKGIFDED